MTGIHTTTGGTLRDAEHAGGTWSLKLSNPAPGIFCTTVSGRMEVPAFRLAVQYFDEIAKIKTPIIVFHDWEKLDGYTPECRTIYLAWAKVHRHQIENAHVLVSSRIVAMGVSVVNMFVGYIVPYNARSVFEAKRANAVPRPRKAKPG